MKLRRFLRPEAICIELQTRAIPDEEVGDSFDPESRQNMNRVRDSVLSEITMLFENTGLVSNATRLHRDLANREKKASTAIGKGVAVPHLRTLQVKSFIMAFARSAEGVPFHAPDDEPVHLFFAMLAPPYDDRTYLKVYKDLALLLLDPEHFETFMQAETPDEILRNMELF